MNTESNNSFSGLFLKALEEYVFVVDMHGIQQIFSDLKSKLVSGLDSYLSVLYISNNSSTPPLFKDELAYFEKRFHSRFSLTITFLKEELTFDSKQLEVIINCAPVEHQNFIVSGEHDFAYQVVDQLLFLGINKNRIQIHKINS